MIPWAFGVGPLQRLALEYEDRAARIRAHGPDIGLAFALAGAAAAAQRTLMSLDTTVRLVLTREIDDCIIVGGYLFNERFFNMYRSKL